MKLKVKEKNQGLRQGLDFDRTRRGRKENNKGPPRSFQKNKKKPKENTKNLIHKIEFNSQDKKTGPRTCFFFGKI
ncbi:MAG: hypothetical protein KIB06_00775 [Peptoniphilus harei]|nr:hypothetical protein [Peptoniphilus harei]